MKSKRKKEPATIYIYSVCGETGAPNRVSEIRERAERLRDWRLGGNGFRKKYWEGMSLKEHMEAEAHLFNFCPDCGERIDYGVLGIDW